MPSYQIILPEVPSPKDYLLAGLLYIFYTDTEGTIPNICPATKESKLKVNLRAKENLALIEGVINKYKISDNICKLHARCGYIEPITENHQLSCSEKVITVAKLLKDQALA